MRHHRDMNPRGSSHMSLIIRISNTYLSLSHVQIVHYYYQMMIYLIMNDCYMQIRRYFFIIQKQFRI